MTADWKLVLSFWTMTALAAAADAVIPASEVNWTLVIVAAITALPLTITQIITLVVTIRNSAKTEAIHVATNSMKDALVKATQEQAHAQGVLDEKARKAGADALVEKGRVLGITEEKEKGR